MGKYATYLATQVPFFGGLCIDDCDCSSRQESEVIQEFIRLDRGRIKDLPARAALPYTHTHTHRQPIPPKHTSATENKAEIENKKSEGDVSWTCGHPLGETAVGFERKNKSCLMWMVRCRMGGMSGVLRGCGRAWEDVWM